MADKKNDTGIAGMKNIRGTSPIKSVTGALCRSQNSRTKYARGCELGIAANEKAGATAEIYSPLLTGEANG